MISKMSNSALQGIQRSTQGMARSAAEIARASRPGEQPNMTRALVELKQHEQAAKANVQLGIAYMRDGEMESSLNKFQKALEQDPDLPSASGWSRN